MKKFIIILLVFGIISLSFSQNKIENDLEDNDNISIENIPAIVIKTAGSDFSIYLPDKNPDKNVRELQNEFIYYRLGKDYEGYDKFLVIMEQKDGSLSATYNEKGKLIHVIEKYKNVKLPSEVIYSIYKSFPDWTIVNDKFLYSQKEGDILKKQYNLKIKKGKETKQLIVHPNGKIIKGL
jgi:hypothetical protein